MDQSKKPKSREYPAISLRKAVDMARRIYEKDRWAEAPALTAVKHMGYSGLNGGSKPVLSALRKYGLVEYLGSSANMRVKLTDLAKRILLPVDEGERGVAIREALNQPAIHGELLEAFPQWDLPSDETLAARLEREFGLQNAAVKPFIADLKESIEYANSFRPTALDVYFDPIRPNATESAGHGGGPGAGAENSEGTVGEVYAEAPPGLMKLPMPNSPTYIMLPEQLGPVEARRILAWLKRVVTPAVEFASESEDVGEEV